MIEAYASEIAGQGAVVTPISSPVDGGTLLSAYFTLLGCAIAPDLPAGLRRQMELMRGPAKIALKMGAAFDSWAGMSLAYSARHSEWLEADEARCRMIDQMKGVFSRFDAILAPVAPVAPFPHDHTPFVGRRLVCSNGEKIPYNSMLHWIALATACRLPVTTVPAGLTISGLPIGMQIIGPTMGDARTLAIAQALEERLGGFVAPPPPEGL